MKRHSVDLPREKEKNMVKANKLKGEGNQREGHDDLQDIGG
jgi:hypothetical protein